MDGHSRQRRQQRRWSIPATEIKVYESSDSSSLCDASSLDSSVLDHEEENNDSLTELRNDTPQRIQLSEGASAVGDGEFEDEKADMMARLMSNPVDKEIFASALVERAHLSESVNWLSHHIPGCVLRTLFQTIECARKAKGSSSVGWNPERQHAEGRNDSAIGGRSRTNCSGSTEPEESLTTNLDSPAAPRTESNELTLSQTFDTHVDNLTNAFINARIGSATEDMDTLPITKTHLSALLFVDMSGFTKMSTVLDVESLSNAINGYFEMIVSQIINHGGDILKFAGDAIFAEWKTSNRNPDHDIIYCTKRAALCGADIVANCSDHVVISNPTGFKRNSLRGSITNESVFRGSITNESVDSIERRESIDFDASFERRGSIDLDASFERRGSINLDAMPRRRTSSGYGDCAISSLEEKERPSVEMLSLGGEWQSLSRRNSLDSSGLQKMKQRLSTLNVKCSIGAGEIVGVHLGDNTSRREYLILGDPIRQVALAESVASHGEIRVSPEALQHLSKGLTLKGKYQKCLDENLPFLLAERKRQFFVDDLNSAEEGQPAIRQFAGCRVRLGSYSMNGSSKEKSSATNQYPTRYESSMSNEAQDALCTCDDLTCDDLELAELRWLRNMVSLYAHPVAVRDEEDRPAFRRGSEKARHLAEAELRNVFTCFVSPLVDYNLSGDDSKDQTLFNLLQQVMTATTRELDKVHGHLIQFLLDDKGLVLICTFGLRGSTFPNMIEKRAVPFVFSIQASLEELGVQCRIGSTFGKTYCGVVGGLKRHEFTVLGPSVNLAARLMASPDNPGILVDKDVTHLSSQIFFRPLAPVQAKGYDDLVPIFEPIEIENDGKWGLVKKNFVGRTNEIKMAIQSAKDMVQEGVACQTGAACRMLFVQADSGTGKSSFLVHATDRIKAIMRRVKTLHRRTFVVTNVSRENDSRIPFSLFRSIFRDVLSQTQADDEDSLVLSELSRFSRSAPESSDSSTLSSTSSFVSTMSTDAARFRYICKELDAPPEFMDVVGRKLLGLKEKNPNELTSSGKAPDLQKIVDFIADAFIRSTKHLYLVLLCLDDVHFLDEMSWKVVQAIFERGKKVLMLLGSRPPVSNPLSIDSTFWDNLQGKYCDEGRFSQLNLGPLSESEVRTLTAAALGQSVDDIDETFIQSTMSTSGGIPHHLSCVLDAIKRNHLTRRITNGKIGLRSSLSGESNFASVNELQLSRIDALDFNVRNVLQLCAVMGMEFELIDAALAYSEMFANVKDQIRQNEASASLRLALDAAIEEGILEQSYIMTEERNAEEGDIGGRSMGDVSISLKRRQAHPFYLNNRRIRFTHDSWRQTVLNVLLDERKQEIHHHVAASLERDLENDVALNEDDTFDRRMIVFRHWKLSGNFDKASLMALSMGSQMMWFGFNSQAILLFEDVLSTLTNAKIADEDAEQHFGISQPVLDSLTTGELEALVRILIAKGKSHSTLLQVERGWDAYEGALDIINNTPSADDEGYNRSVSFPIFSGLFVVLKMGAVAEDSGHTYERTLCERFVEQARLNGDPVHYGRALAMQAETLGRLGLYEEALSVVDEIRGIYDIETQHESICKAYGSDRVAQAFTHSVNFNDALGRTEAAFDACRYVVDHLVPKSSPGNIHNMFVLLYAVVVFLKENGQALRAREIFQLRVVDAFEKHFGSGGSTVSKPMFKPILMLLDLQGHQDDEIDVDEYTS